MKNELSHTFDGRWGREIRTAERKLLASNEQINNSVADTARRAAEEINQLTIAELNHKFYGPIFDRLMAIIRKHFSTVPVQKSEVETRAWHQGMRDAAKEVCDACADEYRYGHAHKVKGSTRWWHGKHADFECEAAGIWFALESTAVTPADNNAESLLQQVACSGVEFDDNRVGYVTVQIDRDVWEQLRAYKGDR